MKPKKHIASKSPKLKYSVQSQTGNKLIEIKTDKPYRDIEDNLQAECEGFLKQLNVEYIHIPKILYAKKRFKKKGIPDLMIFKESDSTYPRVLLVELKRDKGKPSQGQKNFARKFTVHLIKNYDNFIEIVTNFLNSND